MFSFFKNLRHKLSEKKQQKVLMLDPPNEINGIPRKEQPYGLSKTSKERLDSCHPHIQAVVNEVLHYVDVVVIEGARPKHVQDEYYMKGTSKVKYPNSYHNTTFSLVRLHRRPYVAPGDENVECSLAVDLGPYPLNWDDTKGFRKVAAVVKKVAKQKRIPLDWGYDLWKWDMPHYQLTSYRKRKKEKYIKGR